MTFMSVMNQINDYSPDAMSSPRPISIAQSERQEGNITKGCIFYNSEREPNKKKRIRKKMIKKRYL
jgi:hypothetical protein